MKSKNNAYCTLFDSMYADKGLVMIYSFLAYNSDSLMFVLCMDDACFSIISSEKKEQVIPISLDDFLDSELLVAKNNRGKGEFCWSCTGKLIKYVMDHYDIDYCTYVDSDLYFYANPDIMVQEMIDEDCYVQVVPHRFPNKIKWKKIEAQSGKNCVQFNTFSNNMHSRKLLDKWIEQCMEKCDKYCGGDQIYTSDWDKYSFVHVSNNEGGGLAPWNIENYCLVSGTKKRIRRKDTLKEYGLVFYHFQGLEYINRYRINIHIRKRITFVDQELVNFIYLPYLLEIEETKSKLFEEYGIVPLYSHSTGLFGGNVNTSIKYILSDVFEIWNVKKDTYDIKKIDRMIRRMTE